MSRPPSPTVLGLPLVLAATTPTTAAAFRLERVPTRVSEGEAARFILDREPTDPSRIRLLPTSGTATAGEDFAARPIDLGPDRLSTDDPVDVPTVADGRPEPDETFTLRSEDASLSATVPTPACGWVAPVGLPPPPSATEAAASWST